MRLARGRAQIRPANRNRRLQRGLRRPPLERIARARPHRSAPGRRRRGAFSAAAIRLSGSRYCRSSRASRPTRWSSSASRTFSATGWRGCRGGGATSTSSSPRQPTFRRATSSSTPTTASAATRRWRRSMSRGRRTTACACSMPATTNSLCRSRISRSCRALAPRIPAVQLDRLGGVAWQSRKARVKQRIRDIAGELIRVAAERQLRPGDIADPARRDLRGVRRPLSRIPRPRTS